MITAVTAVACGANPGFETRTSSPETYALSGLEIDYPYDDPRPDVGPRDDRASVTFHAAWPESGFPGNANCELNLTGEGGELVGDFYFQLTIGTDGARVAPMVVPISEEPVSGTGSCKDDRNEDPSGSGYLFTGPTRISAHTVPYQLPGRMARPLTVIEFDVSLEHPGGSPGMRTCYLYVTRTDGTEDPPEKYGMLVGEGSVEFDVKGEPETIDTARVTCGPFEA